MLDTSWGLYESWVKTPGQEDILVDYYFCCAPGYVGARFSPVNGGGYCVRADSRTTLYGTLLANTARQAFSTSSVNHISTTTELFRVHATEASTTTTDDDYDYYPTSTRRSSYTPVSSYTYNTDPMPTKAVVVVSIVSSIILILIVVAYCLYHRSRKKEAAQAAGESDKQTPSSEVGIPGGKDKVGANGDLKNGEHTVELPASETKSHVDQHPRNGDGVGEVSEVPGDLVPRLWANNPWVSEPQELSADPPRSWQPQELSADPPRSWEPQELDADRPKSQEVQELSAEHVRINELPVDTARILELPADNIRWSELPADGLRVTELDGRSKPGRGRVRSF